MDDEEGKGAAGSQSTGVDVDVDAADVQAKAKDSTMHSSSAAIATAGRMTAAGSSTSTSTTSSANAAAAGETDQDGDDAGAKMNHNQLNPFHHGPGAHYGGGGASRRPLPTSLPARSSNSFTPINSNSRQDDHHHQHHSNSAPTLPPIESINPLPPPQTQAPRQRTSLPTARPAPSATSNVSYYPGHTDGRLLPSNYGINPGEMAKYALLPPEPKAFQRQAPKKVRTG